MRTFVHFDVLSRAHARQVSIVHEGLLNHSVHRGVVSAERLRNDVQLAAQVLVEPRFTGSEARVKFAFKVNVRVRLNCSTEDRLLQPPYEPARDKSNKDAHFKKYIRLSTSK